MPNVRLSESRVEAPRTLQVRIQRPRPVNRLPGHSNAGMTMRCAHAGDR